MLTTDVDQAAGLIFFFLIFLALPRRLFRLVWCFVDAWRSFRVVLAIVGALESLARPLRFLVSTFAVDSRTFRTAGTRDSLTFRVLPESLIRK